MLATDAAGRLANAELQRDLAVARLERFQPCRASARRCLKLSRAWVSMAGAIFAKTSCQAGVAGFG
jgi:hypothetical protein